LNSADDGASEGDGADTALAFFAFKGMVNGLDDGPSETGKPNAAPGAVFATFGGGGS